MCIYHHSTLTYSHSWDNGILPAFLLVNASDRTRRPVLTKPNEEVWRLWSENQARDYAEVWSSKYVKKSSARLIWEFETSAERLPSVPEKCPELTTLQTAKPKAVPSRTSTLLKQHDSR